jgi:(p)ppGpp synthase/HD superfamily hydrolase
MNSRYPKAQTANHASEGPYERSFRIKLRETFSGGEADHIVKALDSIKVSNYEDDGLAFALRTAELLIDQQADAYIVTAVLLGPLLKAGRISRSTIEASFGTTIGALVEEIHSAASPGADETASLHGDCSNLLQAARKDIRVLIARIALRLVELESPSEASAHSVLARETREIFIPLADRLGLGSLRGMLEDACFRILEPDTYRAVARAVTPIQETDEICLSLLRKKVTELVEENGVRASVTGRVKSLWALYSKAQRLNLAIDRIMDRLALRIIVASVPACYAVLGFLHTHFRPVPGTFDDYIGLPKDNGYQSIHTCVYPLREISQKAVEFQIRTPAMHLEAEFGAAAHWLYKSKNDASIERARQAQWLQELLKQQERSKDHEDFVGRLRRFVYEPSLIVFLQGGIQIRVPRGSTVGDVIRKASVHPRDIVSAFVNTEASPLDRPLRDGDTVEWQAKLQAAPPPFPPPYGGMNSSVIQSSPHQYAHEA